MLWCRFLRKCRFEMSFDKTSKSSKKRFIEMVDLYCSTHVLIPWGDFLGLRFHSLATDLFKTLTFWRMLFFWPCAELWFRCGIVAFIVVGSWIKLYCNMLKISTVTILSFLSFNLRLKAFGFIQIRAAGIESIWIA